MLRQIYQVKDKKLVIQLPDNFPIGQVEIIILPVSGTNKQADLLETGRNEATAVFHHFLKMDTSHFTAAQQKAYKQTCQLLQQERTHGESRLAGLFAGLVDVSADFDAPLLDESLYWGSETDEYGMWVAK